MERRNVVVFLLNEEHKPTVVWQVADAWPVRLAGPTLDARSREVATEILELAHDGYIVRPVDDEQ